MESCKTSIIDTKACKGTSSMGEGTSALDSG
jgi:hypothetical protein